MLNIEPPWVTEKDPEWQTRCNAVVDKYLKMRGPGSYRTLSLMLSEAWDEWKETRND